MRRVSLTILGLSSFLLALAPFLQSPVTSWLVAGLVATYPAALVVLAVPPARLRRIRSLVIAAMLSVSAGILGITLLRGSVSAAPWIAGMPLGLVLLLALVWLVPFPLVVTAYRRSFVSQEMNVDKQDPER